MTAPRVLGPQTRSVPDLAIRTHAGRELAGRLPALADFVTAGPRVALSRHPGWLPVLAEGLGHVPYALEAVRGCRLWIVDALRYAPHPSHFSVADALSWIERVKPGRAILTNLHSDLDYEALSKQLPPGVEPAFDGLQVTLGGI